MSNKLQHVTCNSFIVALFLKAIIKNIYLQNPLHDMVIIFDEYLHLHVSLW